MPLLINSDTGLAEDLPQDLASQALQAKTHEIPLNDPQGDPVTAPLEGAQSLLSQGYSQPSPEQLGSLVKHAKFSTTEQKLKTFAEGAASAATFGLSTAVERGLDIDPEDILGRQETNPGIRMAGEIAGLGASSLIPGVGAANLMEKAGLAAVKRAGLASADTIVQKIGAGAVKNAVETALFASGDEVHKMLAGDPNQSAETAITNVGLSGLFGAGLGGALGTVSPFWKAANLGKVGQGIEDFKSRLRWHMDNPEPSAALTEELTNLHKGITGVADEVYGPTGIKAQELEKIMPRMNEKMPAQIEELSGKMRKSITSLGDDPLARVLQKEFDKFQSTTAGAVDPITLQPIKIPNPSDLFDAIQKAKQKLQELGKFDDSGLTPVSERDFRSTAKNLSRDFRQALEDQGTWGKAAERQQAINSAFKEFLPTLKDFEAKFTTKVGGERTIDPGKVNTYVNQLGKPTAEIKQEMLGRFMKEAENYRQVIDKSHANLGIESPFANSSMSVAQNSLEQMTSGAKLADKLVRSGFAQLGGKTLGAGVGGIAGHAVGSGGIGALIGEHALGPFFSSVLPYIAKPLLNTSTSPSAAKAAIDFAMSVAKGEAALSRSAKAIFESGKKVIPENMVPKDTDRSKIKKSLEKTQENPESLLDTGGEIVHYMPDHASSLAGIAGRASEILNQMKPSTHAQSPLDPQREPSAQENEKYNRALDIAEQPLLLFQHLKDGTLTPDDVHLAQSLYPALYGRMAQKIMGEVISHTAKGKLVDYKMRPVLSLFLGQPMDSTLLPQNIIGAQPKPPMPPSLVSGNRKKGSMQHLGKIDTMYQTPEQKREIRRAGS